MLATLLNLSLAIAGLPAGVAPAAELQSALSGDWEISEPAPVVQARIDAVVEQSAATFFWAIRPLVRHKLRQGALWCGQLHLALDDRQLSLQCQGQQALVRGLDDRDGPQRLDDGRVIDTTTALLDGRTLELQIRGDEGARIARYHSPAPDRLRVEVEITSPHLPTPMRWTQHYRRRSEVVHAATR